MLKAYRIEAQKRQEAHLPPLPLTPEQTREALALLDAEHEESPFLLKLIAERVEPGVSKAAKLKADWLFAVAKGEKTPAILSQGGAIDLLKTMGGGYNVEALIELLALNIMTADVSGALKRLTKIYNGFDKIALIAKTNAYAQDVISSWAGAEWFVTCPSVPEEILVKIYKVEGEINTDDFSPGSQAQSRADIPLHATFFGYKRFPTGIDTISQWQKENFQVAFAGDVVGTGSSRKSAVNSMLWHTGFDIPHIPNKRSGGLVFGGTIAPIFYATARDAGVLPVECEMSKLHNGDVLVFRPHQWKLFTQEENKEISLQPAPITLLDEYRAGGRLNLIIGQQLTRQACNLLQKPFPSIFKAITNPKPKKGQGYSLAQKIVGKACGLEGVLPGTVCEPKMTTVGSQDTTGPMTMQEIDELACLRFKAELFMQSFCHTAAYPKASDYSRWQIMRDTAIERGGIALQPGDGVIHSWLNRMLIPDTVGTGGDSHTRFPLGISFPAGSGLVAFAAALGFMPMEMPPSVLVRFHSRRRPGITVRDMVNAIPYTAIQQGLLTVSKKGKKNIFAGTILEIEGVDDLTVEEAFELADASAERSTAACSIAMPLATVIGNIKENIKLLQSLVDRGYSDTECLVRRIAALKAWLEKPQLLHRDDHAEFKAVLEIDLASIIEPLLACPNDPDDVRPLSEVAGDKIDEAFIGSCMTHLSHLQNAVRIFTGEEYAQARLWIAPATRMDRDAIAKAGGLATFAQVGGRVEIPGCSLCMGNQARVRPGTTVISTSTRNFDNRLGDKTRVYLGSSELTAISALKGKLPTVKEYFECFAAKIDDGVKLIGEKME